MSRLDYTIENLTCNNAQIELLNVINKTLDGTDIGKHFIHIKYVRMNTYVLSYYTNMDFLMESELVKDGDILTITAVPQYEKSDHVVAEFKSPDILKALSECLLAGGFN